MREQITNMCEELGCQILFMEGFDEAILGTGTKFHHISVIYSKKKILKKLCEDMDYDDAIEYFDYNIAGAYVGENTPIIFEDDVDFDIFK